MSPKKPLNHYLMKLNRALVWILLLLMILLVVTGYGLTKPNLIHFLTGGIINYRTALYLQTFLDVYILILLLLHVVIEFKFSLIRWGFKNERLLNLLMLTLGSISLILILYVDSARI